MERPSSYLILVHWENLEEVNDFGESGHQFARCWRPVIPLLAGRREADHFVERPGLTFQGQGVITDLAWLNEQLWGDGVRSMAVR